MTTRARNPGLFRKTLLATALGIATAPTLAAEFLEEIVVTAQKREQTLQDVTATVNVVTGDSIDRFAAFDFSEIESQTAGLTLSSPNARNSTIALRGVSVDPESGSAAAVDVYWNGAVVRPDVAFTQLYDIERIEVLRGPQGTLQGRTSPAGAINLITRGADTQEANGNVRLSISDNDGLNTQAAYGAPLIEDVLAVRVAGVYDTSAGADVKNVTTGFDDQELEAISGRLSTLWDVTDTLSAELIWQYMDQEKDDPKAMSGTDARGERPTLVADDRTALAPTNNAAEFEFDVANLLLNWDVLGHDVAAIVGYQDSSKVSRTENDRADSLSFTDIDAPTFQSSDTSAESWEYELRLASQDNDFWNYMVGVFYQDQNTSTQFVANSVRTQNAIGFNTAGAIPFNRNTGAVFTFNEFALTDTLQLEVGLRWTSYDTFRRADVDFVGLTYLPPALEGIADIVEDGFRAGFPINAVDDAHDREDAFTGSVKMRWDWTEETALYVSYNRGYRPGGISISPSPAVGNLPNGQEDLLYSEEESDAYELGFKSRLMDGRATLNGALYLQEFDGYQGFVRGVQVLDEEGVPQDLPGGIVFNGDAVVWGAELEGEVLLLDTWRAAGALSYNSAEWDGATSPCNDRAPGEVIGVCDIDGEPISGEPEWSLSLNSEYYVPMDSTEVYIRGLFKYTDKRLNTDASAGLGAVTEEFASYEVVDLFLGWRSADFTWDVNIWAKNLFDEKATLFQQGPDQYDIALSDGSYTQTNVLQERIFGMTASYNF